MNKHIAKRKILEYSAFAFVAGSVFSLVGIYTGGLESLVMPEAFLALLSVFGVVL